VLAVVALALGLGVAAVAAPKNPAPSPSPTGSSTPAPPLPTATPEPPSVAIPRLEAKLKANPDDRDTMGQLASFYLEVGRPDLSLPMTQKLLSSGTKTAQIFYLDGLANEQIGHIREATDDLEQSSNLEPTNAQVLLTLTDLYLRTGRAADAERIAKRATTFNQNDERSFLNYGLVLAQEKKYDEARVQFEAASKLDPKDATPIVIEAKSYEDQSALPLAASTYDRAIAIDPRSIDAWVGKARVLVAQHQMKDAAATYEKIIPLLNTDDEKATVVAEEARAYATEKQNADAETQYKRAISTYPKSMVGHVSYGDYLAATGNVAQAEVEWTAALGANRDNKDALLRLGDYYLRRNDAQKAIGMYTRLVELAPNDAPSLALLGQAYSYSHQYDKARDAFRKSFDIGRSPASLAGLGVADIELKNYKESAQIFDAIDKGAPELFKQNPQLLFVMAKAYAATDQKTKAKTAYTRFLGYVKPNSQAATEVKKLIADLDARPAASPKPSAKATPAAKPTSAAKTATAAKPTPKPTSKPTPKPSPTATPASH
jgi:tetratricopeptide (TPR) repeat protein